jgi:hypothetical protein
LQEFLENPAGLFKIFSFDMIFTVTITASALCSFYSEKLAKNMFSKRFTEWQILNFEFLTQCTYACYGIVIVAITLIGALAGSIQTAGVYVLDLTTMVHKISNLLLMVLIIRNNCIYSTTFHIGFWRTLLDQVATLPGLDCAFVDDGPSCHFRNECGRRIGGVARLSLISSHTPWRRPGRVSPGHRLVGCTLHQSGLGARPDSVWTA